MKFQDWFKAQFGKRPFPVSLTMGQLISRVNSADASLNRAKSDVYLLEQYDIRFDAAYKSWLAKSY